jgi:uncharacterized protein YjbI with pentapeptide repeats
MADLTREEVEEMVSRGESLAEANLEEARLSGANLNWANFSKSHL